MKLSSMTDWFFLAYSHCKLQTTFKIGCRESPVCFCGFQNETVLEYPLYSTPETNLLSSAGRMHICLQVVFYV